MRRVSRLAYQECVLILVTACGCYGLSPNETHSLIPRDTKSLLSPNMMRSEVLGLAAGFGTTFAAMPDLIAMLRRRSSAGMNPRMAAIMGIFQILWVYYGLLIVSRPVVIWNIIAILVNFISVAAYFYFSRKEKASATAAH
jgi:MtN3 and saliva related transmembrane protein